MKYFLESLRGELAKAVADVLGVDAKTVSVVDSPEKFDSDLAVPCFAFGKIKNVSPDDIAGQLARVLKHPAIEKLESIAGFLNIWLKPSVLAKELSLVQKDYGTTTEGEGKTIVVDFIGLNLSKPFSVGHLRPTVQGWALIQIFKALGYKVIGDSHLGDWGTPFGMWVVGYEKWGSAENLEKDGVYELGRLYIKFREEAEKDETLIDEAKAWLKKLESGDKQAALYHQKFNQISLDHMNTLLDRLKIKADVNLGESFYIKPAQKLVDELISQGTAIKQDDGSVIVDVKDYGLEIPVLLRKGDGSALYATSDIETIRYRLEKWQPSKIIYSVGGEQQFHFKQVFALADKLGYAKNTELKHAWFGTIDEIDTDSGARVKMSSRKNISLLENLLDKAEEEAQKLVGKDEVSKEDVKKIAVGAIKFNDFARSRITNVLFEWDKMFSLSGYSGPYIQYAAVRVNSILNQVSDVTSELSDNYDWQAERELLMQLSRYPETVQMSAREFEPNKIADYLYNLAKLWNRYYELTPVRKAEGEAKHARVWMLNILKQNFVQGLGLLGIEVPEKM